jgi:thiamine-monophosphate kinase
VPQRSGGQPVHALWLVGTDGDAAVGLELLQADRNADGPLVDIFRRPIPQLEAGRALAPLASAMMDVSDGLLIDAQRMAEASSCQLAIDLDRLPLSSAFVAERGHDLRSRLFAATGGDDYALLAALPAAVDPVNLT